VRDNRKRPAFAGLLKPPKGGDLGGIPAAAAGAERTMLLAGARFPLRVWERAAPIIRILDIIHNFASCSRLMNRKKIAATAHFAGSAVSKSSASAVVEKRFSCRAGVAAALL